MSGKAQQTQHTFVIVGKTVHFTFTLETCSR